MKKERASNIELLRIIAMLLIIAFHYAVKSGFWFETVTVNKMLMNVTEMFGELGVNLFILITGYFMINGTFRWKKVFYMILQVLFYNWLSILVLYNGHIGPAIGEAQTADFFPVIYGRYWFMTTYILLYIISPYLNRLVKNLSKKEFEKLLLICLVLWSVIPTIFGARVDDTETLLNYNRFIWLSVVYLLGAYISLYGNEVKCLSYKAGTYFAGSAVMLLLITGIIFLMECNMELVQKIGISSATYFWRPNTILTAAWSLLIFLAFLRLKMPNIKWMNRLASTTLGVYTLHDGRLAGPIWRLWMKGVEYQDSAFLIVHMIVSVLIVFMVCAVIELLRQTVVRYGKLAVQHIKK